MQRSVSAVMTEGARHHGRCRGWAGVGGGEGAAAGAGLGWVGEREYICTLHES